MPLQLVEDVIIKALQLLEVLYQLSLLVTIRSLPLKNFELSLYKLVLFRS